MQTPPKTTSISYGRTKANSKENYIACSFHIWIKANHPIPYQSPRAIEFYACAYAYVDLMSHASVDFFVLSFVLPCAYAYVAGENQALSCKNKWNYRNLHKALRPFPVGCTHKNCQIPAISSRLIWIGEVLGLFYSPCSYVIIFRLHSTAAC